MEHKIRFKKSKFAAGRRSRPAESDLDSDPPSVLGQTKVSQLRPRPNKARWAKYSELGEKESKREEKEEKEREEREGEEERQTREKNDVSTSPSSLLPTAHLLSEDSPVVVEDALFSQTESGAYTTVKNNTFTLKQSHFRDSGPVLEREYDDAQGVLSPSDSGQTKPDEDINMSDADEFVETGPTQFDREIYDFEILSETSDHTLERQLRRVEVGLVREAIERLELNTKTLKEEIAASLQDLQTLQPQLHQATTARAALVAQLTASPS